MEIELFEHNEIAYQKLNSYLQDNRMASIDHATGTGKSFIALKYLYNHKNKRILYLTPTHYIFNQLIDTHMPKLGIDKKDFNKLDSIIYPNLSKYKMEDIASQYDIIVFDEYHRCGAKQWGTNVKELIKIIKEKYPDKKIIGLTATPTRYLDHERNMNEELFLGKAVSTLTLGDAILQGLLQPPTYVNTGNSCIEYIEYLKNKLNRKFVYQEDMIMYQKLLDTATKKIEEHIALRSNMDIELPRENGKYIVFCNRISDIETNKQIIEKRFKDIKLSFYEVHSNQEREKNERNLADFRENNESSSFIFVVDSLNEGIHIDNIDGIFLLRKTKSPIIYFQQLGRLLSYSTKQKKLVVWDMVDNIKNHSVIYKLYQDVIDKTKKLLIEDPENADKYNQIISNFKIVDNYTGIMTQINMIEEQIDKIPEEELIKIRVSRFINILCDQYKTKSTLPKKIQIEQLFKANEDLYKYYKHITLEQFIKIKNVNIKLPSEINISVEEFENKLLGYNTLYEKELALQLKTYKELLNYVNQNKKLPSILSNDSSEQEYAYSISNAILKCDKKVRYLYKELINNTGSIFDEYYYLNTIKGINYDVLIKNLDYCVVNDIPINKNIYILFTRIYTHPDIRMRYELDKYFGKLKYQYSIGVNTQIIYIEEPYKDDKKGFEYDAEKLRKLKKYGLESIDIEEVKLFVASYVEELIKFIEINGRYPNLSESEECEKYIAFRPFIEELGFKDKLNKKLNNAKDEELESFVEELISFMENNNGDYPSDRVFDKYEISLSKKMKKYEKKLQYYKLKLDSLQKGIRSQNNDDWLYRYVDFLKENRRHPIIQSDNQYERELIIRYIRNENHLNREERKQLKIVIGQLGESEIIKNTFLIRQRVRSENDGTKKR